MGRSALRAWPWVICRAGGAATGTARPAGRPRHVHLMSALRPPPDMRLAAGLAGAFYLVIIAAGVWSEAAVRAPLLMPDDPVATAAAVRAALGSLRGSLAADVVMLLADVGLAVLLYQLLRPHGPVLALVSMVLRLMQAAVLGANLLNLQAAVLLATEGPAADLLGGQADAQLTLSLQAHAHGYDLGLVFFGVNSVLTGILLLRARWGPSALGMGIIAAGAVYLTGSGLRLLAPELSASFAPAYALPLLAESAFCAWLLWMGAGRGRLTAR